MTLSEEEIKQQLLKLDQLSLLKVRQQINEIPIPSVDSNKKRDSNKNNDPLDRLKSLQNRLSSDKKKVLNKRVNNLLKLYKNYK